MRVLVAALIAMTSARAAAQDGVTTTTEGDAPEEAESQTAQPRGPALLYTRELSDEELARRFRDDLSSLGSISVGFADRGRLINGVQMPRDPSFIVERPNLSFATRETADGLALAFRAVRRQFPDSAPGRLSHIGSREGGYLRPHRSHQNGRDADIGFYYKKDRIPARGTPREKLMDPARNWALIRTLITETDVQMILVDRKIQGVLRKFALAAGEDAGWLSQVFGKVVKHARSHRDHFHVRFYSPRSQELGRRIQPLLALRPDQNFAVHLVRAGNTLGQIADRYNTTVVAIRKVNRMKRSSLLQLGQHLVVPLRGPCTHCPLPPPALVPPRCTPPEPLPTIAQSWLGGINPEMATAE